MTDTPSEGFLCFAEWLALSPCQTQRFYTALRESGDRHARSVLFALERFAARRSRSGMLRDLARFGLGPGSPQNLIGLLERLIEQGLLSRNEAVPIEDAILARIGAHGQYR